MVEELPFTYLHVFTYSARPGTPAATMLDQVPVHVARERNRVLRELAAEKKLIFMQGFVGQRLEAITLNTGTDSYTDALTENYLKLRLAGKHNPNHWVVAHVEAVQDGVLAGHPVSSRGDSGSISPSERHPEPRGEGSGAHNAAFVG
jgi:threonylcarbamoyladenosine tRNA methylthiotransferase MtaB